jgi:phosphoglycerate dehydrogenase-like enzyme
VSREELLSRSDFVTIHLKLSPRTVGLIGETELALMKPDAYLINTSRGPIVDEVALLAAVRGGVIAGAAVDVFDQEPLPVDHPFRTEPRILATPHIGYVSRESYQVFFEGVIEAIEAWRGGEPIRLLT